MNRDQLNYTAFYTSLTDVTPKSQEFTRLRADRRKELKTQFRAFVDAEALVISQAMTATHRGWSVMYNVGRFLGIALSAEFSGGRSSGDLLERICPGGDSEPCP